MKILNLSTDDRILIINALEVLRNKRIHVQSTSFFAEHDERMKVLEIANIDDLVNRLK